MGESKNFIKNAVGLLIIVAICFISVMLYKKGNDSISKSIQDYDNILNSFHTVKLEQYKNSTTTGNEIMELIQNLKEEDGIKICVTNGYSKVNRIGAKEYDYGTVFSDISTVLKDIKDKTKQEEYINPLSKFSSDVVYNENGTIASLVFVQK